MVAKFANSKSVKPFKIAASCVPLVDHIVEPTTEQRKKLIRLAEEKDLRPGTKDTSCTTRFFTDLFNNVEKITGDEFKKSRFTGGNNSNIVATLKRLFGNVEATLVGVLGSDEDSEFFKQAHEDIGVKIIPGDAVENADKIEIARSIIFPLENDRVVRGVSGNAGENFYPKQIPTRPFKQADLLILQANHARKMGKDHLDTMLKHRWDNKKKMCFPLPTKLTLSDEEKEYFRYVASSSDVILGNAEEAGHVFANFDATHSKENPMEVAEKVHEFLKAQYEKTGNNPKKSDYAVVKKHLGGKQVAFITAGEKGAFVITHDDIIHVEIAAEDKVQSQDIKNTIGAGDTTSAGFIAGLLAGYDYTKAAELGLKLGAAVIKQLPAKLEYPRAVLQGTEFAKMNIVDNNFFNKGAGASSGVSM